MTQISKLFAERMAGKIELALAIRNWKRGDDTPLSVDSGKIFPLRNKSGVIHSYRFEEASEHFFADSEGKVSTAPGPSYEPENRPDLSSMA